MNRIWRSLTLVFLASMAAAFAWISLGIERDMPRAPQLQWQWVVVAALLLALCAIAGYIVNGRWTGILIDDRHRISLSRFQWTGWFTIILSSYFVGTVLNVVSGQASPFPAIQPDLFALIGLSTGSAVISSLVVDTKKNAPAAPEASSNIGSIDLNATAAQASWKDLYCGEEVSNRDVVDVSRLQQLVTTLLLMFTYIVFVWRDLGIAGFDGYFPQMPSVGTDFVGLLGASHAGYLAYKATPKTAAPSPQ